MKPLFCWHLWGLQDDHMSKVSTIKRLLRMKNKWVDYLDNDILQMGVPLPETFSVGKICSLLLDSLMISNG